MLPNTVDDNRVEFFKGWFEETLAFSSVPDHDVMVVNLDADLYSPAKTVVRFLKNQVRVGACLDLDESNDRDNKLRAFDEFLKETGMKFQSSSGQLDFVPRVLSSDQVG